MIEAAKPQLAAMILLSLNCGYNNTDSSELLWSHNEDDGWLRTARQKKQVDCAGKLWPETTAALETYPGAAKGFSSQMAGSHGFGPAIMLSARRSQSWPRRPAYQ